jgi:hypothetical protein
MNICPYCERNNQDGEVLCRYCGRSFSLLGAGVPTLLKRSSSLFFEAVVMAETEDSEKFAEDAAAVLFVGDSSLPHVLPIEALAVLGRASADRTLKPNLDLSAYDAYNRGVSARHAALQRAGDRLFLRDLGSTNGTYLNGERLTPYQPEALRHGDEIHLGQLKLRILFERQKGSNTQI